MPRNRTPAAVEQTPRPLVALANDYPDGHVIAPHRHQRAQLIFAASGVLDISAAAGTWIVPPQRAVWMPAGVEHWLTCRGGSVAMRSLYVLPSRAEKMPRDCRVVQVSPLLRELILQAVDLPLLYDEGGAEGRLVAVILDQIAALPAAPLHLPAARDPRLRTITEALLADPADDRDLEAWATSVGVGARTMARLFQNDLGMSFGAWRQQARLLRAVAWLAEGRSVTATAFDLGYDSPSAFIAMFRRSLGETPGRYVDGRDHDNI